MSAPPPSHEPPPAGDDLGRRKADHLTLAREGDVAFDGLTTGFERIRLRARALPERDLADVDLGASLCGRRLAAPLLVSCMTGGTADAGAVNEALAIAAQAHGVALGLGSGRVLLREPEDATVAASFAVRRVAPDVALLANLGAVSLHHYTAADCARLVERCEADALVLHCNAVQEAVQPGGDTEFAGVLSHIEHVCRELSVPVIVKEVGFGLGPDDVRALLDAGVAGVDVAGAGGTNWARVEGLRDHRAGRVAAAFGSWGWPTAEAVALARRTLDAAGSAAALIASGGLRDGVDAAKALCLGADAAGVARGLLADASRGPDAAIEGVGVLVDQLRIAAWAAGVASRDEFGPHLLRSEE